MSQYENDQELVRRAREGGPDSPEYRYLSDALQEQGLGFLIKLHGKGQLFAELSSKRIRVPMPPPRSYPAHVRTLIHLSVKSAEKRFMRRQVIDGGWTSSKGASLRTFFVNGSLFAFAEEYLKFYNEETVTHEISVEDVEIQAEEHHALRVEDPERTIANRALIDWLLPPGHDNKLRTMFTLTAEGYTQAEIATKLGTTAEAVSMAIRKHRNRVKEMMRELN